MIQLMTETSNQVKVMSSEVNFTWPFFLLLDQETFHDNQQNHPDQELDGNEFSEVAAAKVANRPTQASQIEKESSSNGFVESIIAKEKDCSRDSLATILSIYSLFLSTYSIYSLSLLFSPNY